MSISTVEAQALATEVSFTEHEFIVSLVDGRTLSVPLEWFPTLAKASKSQRSNYELLGDGEGIHWPDLDEDISIDGLLRGDGAKR